MENMIQNIEQETKISLKQTSKGFWYVDKIGVILIDNNTAIRNIEDLAKKVTATLKSLNDHEK